MKNRRCLCSYCYSVYLMCRHMFAPSGMLSTLFELSDTNDAEAARTSVHLHDAYALRSKDMYVFVLRPTAADYSVSRYCNGCNAERCLHCMRNARHDTTRLFHKWLLLVISIYLLWYGAISVVQRCGCDVCNTCLQPPSPDLPSVTRAQLLMLF